MDHAVSIVEYDIILPVIILRIVMVITRLFLSHEEVWLSKESSQS